MGVTTSGLRWPEPTDPVAQGALAMRNLAEDVTARGARYLGFATLTTTTLPAGGGTLGLGGTITVAAVSYARIVLVTLDVLMSSATTWSTFTLRNGGTDIGTFRGVTPQHQAARTFVDQVPANATRSYQGLVTSSAAVSVYGSPQSALYAVALHAA